MAVQYPWQIQTMTKPNTNSTTMTKSITKIAAFILLSICQIYIGYTLGSIVTERKLNQELIERGVKEYNNRTGQLQYIAVLGLYSNTTPEPTTSVVPGVEALLPKRR